MMHTHFRRNAILGALVADAASLGFHWLYDQSRIKEVAPEKPEFAQPKRENYRDEAGFFAHDGKNSGDFSHYGEQMIVLLNSLAQNEGEYQRKSYERSFRAHFGYGGQFVGYIDHPTRDTLDNMARAEFDAIARATALPTPLDENGKHMMITKALGNIDMFEGEERRRNLEIAVRQTHDHDETVAYAFRILSELESIDHYHGADDEQLPALSKVPALLATNDGIDGLLRHVESAVRVTHNNDKAVAYGQAAAHLLKAATDKATPSEIIARAKEDCTTDITALIDEALAHQGQDTPSVTEKFGSSCHLDFGSPSIIHNFATSQSYREGVRKNIYSGGDSCGRSILLGALLGGLYGVGGEKGIPEEWIQKLTQHDSVHTLLAGLA